MSHNISGPCKQRCSHLEVPSLTTTACLVCGQPARHQDALQQVHSCGHCVCHGSCIITLFNTACNDRSLFPPRCSCNWGVSLSTVLQFYGPNFVPVETRRRHGLFLSNRRDPALIRCASNTCSHPVTDREIVETVENGGRLVACFECPELTCFRCEKLNSYHIEGHRPVQCVLRCVCGYRFWRKDPDGRWYHCDCGREICSVCEKGPRYCDCPSEDETTDEEEGWGWGGNAGEQFRALSRLSQSAQYKLPGRWC